MQILSEYTKVVSAVVKSKSTGERRGVNYSIIKQAILDWESECHF